MTNLPVLSCDNCGACCEAQGSPPGYESPASRAHLPAEARAELDSYYLSTRKLGPWRRGLPCLWYDPVRQRCRHYDWRPSICREFTLGSAECREWRRLLHADECVPAGVDAG